MIQAKAVARAKARYARVRCSVKDERMHNHDTVASDRYCTAERKKDSCTPSSTCVILDLFEYSEQTNDKVGAVHNQANHHETNQRKLTVAEGISDLSYLC